LPNRDFKSPWGRSKVLENKGSRFVANGGLHFDIDLHLVFPQGNDWLALSVDFKTNGFPLDGLWHAGQ
jgi:hypothetical protein